MRLSITDIEAARKGREARALMRIERAARIGGALPRPEFQRSGRRNIEIYFGPVKIVLWSETGPDIETSRTIVNVYNDDLERKLFELFPDKAVTKRLYDYIFEALDKYIESQDAKLMRTGETKFCG